MVGGGGGGGRFVCLCAISFFLGGIFSVYLSGREGSLL